MKYKVIDAAWIADRSLDIYCATNMERRRSGGLCTKASVGNIFEEVFSHDVAGLVGKYDKVFVVAPCFPIMRLKGVSSIITRFICSNAIYLRDNGVSISQFFIHFEKFIQSKWKNGDFTAEGNVYLLKSKGALYHDWVEALVERFGTTLLDTTRSEAFASNPGFISTMEGNLDIYREIEPMEKFKLRSLVEKCVSN